MNKSIIVLVTVLLIFGIGKAQQNTGIGVNNPDASAMLEVYSTNQGFLPPRVANVNAINAQAEGLMIYDISRKCMRYYNGVEWSDCMGGIDYYTPSICNNSTDIVEVTNPATGAIWMDRNLGASQVATSSTDAAAYGDLHQWGRFSDGHQCRTSLNITGTLATTSIPNIGNSWDSLYIVQPDDPQDWLQTEDDNLWQDINDANTPCPSGFRLPTKAEFATEGLSWSSVDAAGAYASPLKFTMAGVRTRQNGSIVEIGTEGSYWSSTIAAEAGNSYVLRFKVNLAGNDYWRGRANGFSVRCIKD